MPLVLYLKSHRQKQGLLDFLPCCLLEVSQFCILHFTFRPLIHLSYLCWGCKVRAERLFTHGSLSPLCWGPDFIYVGLLWGSLFWPVCVFCLRANFRISLLTSVKEFAGILIGIASSLQIRLGRRDILIPRLLICERGTSIYLVPPCFHQSFTVFLK